MRTRVFHIYQATTVHLEAATADRMVHLHLTTTGDEPLVISLTSFQIEQIERHIAVLRTRSPELFER